MAARLVYLFDADLKGIGEAISKLRDDVAVIGDDRSRIPDIKDELWFPEAGQRGLIVIRRDGDVLNQRSEERRVWERHKLRGFVLAISEPATSWDEFYWLIRAWANMEDHVQNRMRGQNGWVARILRQGRVKPS